MSNNIAKYSIAMMLFYLYFFVNCSASEKVHYVNKALAEPKIDGLIDERIWQHADWRAIDKLILGPPVAEQDFSARYKLLWTEEYLYLLVELVDDVLSDKYADPLSRYWEDDALEIFIDEDASGGIHQFDYNAFAYHIALDNQAVDIGPFLSEADKKMGNVNVRVFPNHIHSQWRRSLQKPHKVIWEVAIRVFSDAYKDSYSPGETPIVAETLHAGKKLGFMLAYCDSDSSPTRENFISDIDVPAVNGDKNRGYIDASVFGSIILRK